MSRGTLDTGHLALPFVYRALTFCGLPFQVVRLGLAKLMPVLNPKEQSSLVWALPRSLAAT